MVAGNESSEGPHQLRIGLRRLRTAFAVFGESLGKDGLAPLSAVA
ncbi:metal-binding protein, partial [Amaricoccus sp. HAR-UPW-R2A-40]